MKVRCTDNEGGRYPLTIGKIYEVIRTSEVGGVDTYQVTNDKGIVDDYFTHRFEVVQDATKRVRCVDNSMADTELTLDKVYDVVSEMSSDYKVIDDMGRETYFLKKRFVPVSNEVVESATQAAPTLPAPPQDPPFDFDAYNGIKNIRKVHIP